MLKLSYQVNDPLRKGKQDMMTIHWHYAVPEQEVICSAFFIYGISFKTTLNHIVSYSKILFSFALEPNGLFIFGHIMPSIPEPLEVVYGIIH